MVSDLRAYQALVRFWNRTTAFFQYVLTPEALDNIPPDPEASEKGWASVVRWLAAPEPLGVNPDGTQPDSPSFLNRLLTREPLEFIDSGDDARAKAPQDFLHWLLAPENLDIPGETAPSAPRKANFLQNLLAREPLGVGTDTASSGRPQSFTRWLLARESLDNSNSAE